MTLDGSLGAGRSAVAQGLAIPSRLAMDWPDSLQAGESARQGSV